ncbi:hypothetical protein ABZ949_28575 [Micromonospora tulbaghiae]|uniref:hypothetical protein n=1 Tax=Micromonospora tulbaghiae TaxID=479978 RepID=UPI00340D746D
MELSGSWTRETTDDGVTGWHASGRAVRAGPGASWRCADASDIIAALDGELPPNPAAKVGEGGRDGVGHRAAWLYRHDDGVEFTLYGFTFVDGAYLETVFTGAVTPDLEWAFDAWRSVTRSVDG